MAEKKDLTPHQKGIVRRYYENREAISTQKLAEIVSELYLATTEKKANQLWERAEKALKHAGADPVWLEKVVADRNVEGLAEIVNELF
jgi:ribosomal protein L17